MKKKILFIGILALLGVLLALGGKYIYQSVQKQSQTPISMIIASDTHYLSPEYRGTYFKEPNAIFDGKLIHYSSEYFDAFLAEVMEKKPQVLILSGDITLNGSQKSHREVTAKLEKVEEAGIDVLVIPGNHDLHTTAGDYSSETPVVVEGTDAALFSEMYENFGPSQAISRDENTFSYVYEATPYLRILMIDTNSIVKCQVETDTLAWIETELKDARRAGADVIAVTHQNLHIHNELIYFSYQLYNAADLLALFEKYDVDLNLSGHIHVQSIVTDTSVPEVAVGSLAICGTPYGEIAYDGKQLSYTTTKTDVASYALANGWTDENLLDFENYSTFYFEEVGRLQNYASFAETDLSEEEKNLLADTFAKMNAYYFLGEPFDPTEFSAGIELWNKQEGDFTSRYIETMLKNAETGNQTLTIDLN